VPRPLPRFDAAQQRVADVQQVERILREVDHAESDLPVTGGEASRRGIPIVGRGTGGAIPHTSPEQVLLAKGRRRWRR
jgi:hypothetical protein